MKNDAKRVLVVEDDPSLRELLLEELEEFEPPALQPTAVQSAEDARSRLDADDFALVVSDLRLPGADGFDLLRYACHALDEPPAFIMITAFGTVARAVDALRSGASDFLTIAVPGHAEFGLASVSSVREIRTRSTRSPSMSTTSKR